MVNPYSFDIKQNNDILPILCIKCKKHNIKAIHQNKITVYSIFKHIAKI